MTEPKTVPASAVKALVSSDVEDAGFVLRVHRKFKTSVLPGGVTTHVCLICGKTIVTRTGGNSFVRMTSHASQHGELFD